MQKLKLFVLLFEELGILISSFLDYLKFMPKYANPQLFNLIRNSTESRELLKSDEGKKHRSKRPADVEQTFGNLKANKGFKRFLLRGIKRHCPSKCVNSYF